MTSCSGPGPAAPAQWKDAPVRWTPPREAKGQHFFMGGTYREYLFMGEHPPLSQDGLSPSETPLLQREGRTQLEQVPGQS